MNEKFELEKQQLSERLSSQFAQRNKEEQKNLSEKIHKQRDEEIEMQVDFYHF
jgi:hypothetical protein